MMFSTKSTSKFNVVLNILFSLFFYLTLVSIPVCSFNRKILLITWICAGLLFLVVLIKFIYTKRFSYNTFILYPLIFLAFSMLFSSLLNLNGDFTFTPFILIGVMIVLHFFFVTFPEIRLPALILIALSIFTFLCVFVFMYRNELFSRDFYRLGTIFGDQNEIAMFLSLGAIFCVYFVLFSKKVFVIIISLIVLPVFIYCGFSTGSKLFLLTFVCCLVFFIFTFFGKRWWASLLVIGSLIGIGFLIISLPAFASYKTRILNFFNFFAPTAETTDFSTYDRFEMFLGGMHMFATKPIFGYGTLGFAQLSSFGRGAHNTLAQMLCNYGIVGFSLFSIPFIFSIYSYFAKKETRIPSSVISCAIVIFFVVSGVSLYLDIQKNYAFMIPLAFAELIGDDSNNKSYFFSDVKNIFKFRHNNINCEATKNINAKTKVCFIVSNFGLGGPQELVMNLIENIDKESFDVSVISMFNKVNEKYQKIISKHSDVKFYFLDKQNGRFSFSFIRNLRRLFKQIDPDIYSTHTSALLYTAMLNIFNKKVIIHTIHSIPEYDQKKLVRLFLKPMIKKGRILFVGCSKTISDLATKLYKMNTTFINNGIALPNNCEETIKEFDFFTLGRLVEMKRIDWVIKAFASINSNGDYSLAIVGDGPEKQTLCDIVKKNHVLNVKFLGEIDDVGVFLKKSRIHLMASRWEGNPMSILESMAYGIPTIAPNVGGVPDIVINERNGLLYDADNPEELERLIRKILDKKIYYSLSNNCFEDSKKYDIKITTKSYEEMFKNWRRL